MAAGTCYTAKQSLPILALLDNLDGLESHQSLADNRARALLEAAGAVTAGHGATESTTKGTNTDTTTNVDVTGKGGCRQRRG